MEKYVIIRFFNSSDFLQLLISHTKLSYINLWKNIFVLFFFIVIPSVLLSTFGVPLLDIFKFMLYVSIYQVVNGVLVLRIFNQDIKGNMWIPLVLLCGMGYNMISLFSVSIFNLQEYVILNPLFLFLISIIKEKISGKKNFELFNDIQEKSIFQEMLIILMMLVPLIYGMTQNYFQPFEDHFLFQGAITSAVAYNAYPYTFLQFPEISLFYNYGYHLEVAACHFVTGIDIVRLVGRIYPLYVYYLLIATVFSFCREHIEGKIISGILLLISVFCTSVLFSKWHIMGITSSMTLTTSPAFGMLCFFLSISIINEVYLKKRPSPSNFIFLFFLFFIGSIIRSAYPLILGGGLFIFSILDIIKHRNKDVLIKTIKIGALLGFAFLVTLAIVYGYFSSHSSASFLKIVPQNTKFLGSNQVKEFISNLLPVFSENHPFFPFSLTALFHLLIAPSYLLVGFIYQIYKWFKNSISFIELILLLCAITGIIFWNFTEAPGASHYTFYHYVFIIFGIFGASGTYHILKDSLVKKDKKIFILLILAVSLLGYRFIDFYQNYSRVKYLYKNNHKMSYEYFDSFFSPVIECFNLISMNVEKMDNQAVIFLSSQPRNRVEPYILNIKLPHQKLYFESVLKYLLQHFLIRTDRGTKNRIKDIIANIKSVRETNELSEETLTNFKNLFPDNDLLFVIDKEISIHNHILREVGSTEKVKLMKYSPNKF